MVLEEVPNATDNQLKFISDLIAQVETLDGADIIAQKIHENTSQLSTRSASVCINYLRFRVSELQTGFKVATLE